MSTTNNGLVKLHYVESVENARSLDMVDYRSRLLLYIIIIDIYLYIF